MKVQNKDNIGNPYHDNDDGKFTSADGFGSGKTNSNEKEFDDLNEEELLELYDDLFENDLDEFEDSFSVSDVKSKTTWIDDIDDELLIVRNYPQQLESFLINRALRKNNLSMLDDTLIRTIAVMDRCMKPLGDDLGVIRMVEEDFLPVLNVPEKLLDRVLNQGDNDALMGIKNLVFNKVITEKAFLSTCYDIEENVFTARPIRLQMHCKKGSKALFSPTKKEAEIILPRGTKYKIKDVTTEQYRVFKHLVIHVEVL